MGWRVGRVEVGGWAEDDGGTPCGVQGWERGVRSICSRTLVLVPPHQGLGNGRGAGLILPLSRPPHLGPDRCSHRAGGRSRCGQDTRDAGSANLQTHLSVVGYGRRRRADGGCLSCCRNGEPMPGSRGPQKASCSGMAMVKTLSRPSYTLSRCRRLHVASSLSWSGLQLSSFTC
ncbi:hypothetical protein BDU57DRAFT_213265 [Ampelomyces quisqualis]|uniref:Uncharacterized protein n=1 Tax=Ampelomyces quisqualis TaxID=50730 RepID=A0A6A5QK96_AMPQU|nr:hypothetical protein BDU57DRAFT_213265 [Ampelomyces quisqualis]